jgi:hypothetical protein
MNKSSNSTDSNLVPLRIRALSKAEMNYQYHRAEKKLIGVDRSGGS